MKNVLGSLRSMNMQPESAFNNLSKMVKFHFGGMLIVVFAYDPVLTLHRGEVSGGRLELGEKCSRVIAKYEYAARFGIQPIFQNGEIPLKGMLIVVLAYDPVLTLHRGVVWVGRG